MHNFTEDDTHYVATGVATDNKSIDIANPGVKDAKDTSYTYIVKADDLKTTLVITVKKADTNTAKPATYALELSADSVDAVIKSSDATNAATTVTAKVCGYDTRLQTVRMLHLLLQKML